MRELDPRLYGAIGSGKFGGATVPTDVDRDLTAIAVGKELGVPAVAVRRQPLHLVVAALARLEAQQLIAERQREDAARRYPR